MRVIEYDRFGGPEVLVVRERTLPAPRAGEVRIAVRAAALNPKDLLIRAGKFAWLGGYRFPKRSGYDWSGEAEAVGPGVEGIREGDALFGMVQSWQAGACADGVVARADELAAKPKNLTWEEAAALPLASLTALQALRDVAGARKGQRVIINGASGGVGGLAVQLAKVLGLAVSTATSPKNFELVRGLGAEQTLDYADLGAALAGQTWDIFFDVFGNRSLSFAKPYLAPGGRYVSTIPKPALLWEVGRTLLSSKRAKLIVVRSRRADLELVASYVDQGLLKPILDSVFPLSDVVLAHQRLATRRARGKVVLVCGEP